MAVIIRMKRTGRKHHPCYRISVADSRKPRDGRTIENLGVYDPLSPVENLRVSLNVERAKHWLSVGALPSRTVRSVFKGQGVFEEAVAAPTKRDRSGRKKKTAKRTTKRQNKAAGLVAKEARRNQRKADKAAAKAAAAATTEE